MSRCPHRLRTPGTDALIKKDTRVSTPARPAKHWLLATRSRLRGLLVVLRELVWVGGGEAEHLGHDVGRLRAVKTCSEFV